MHKPDKEKSTPRARLMVTAALSHDAVVMLDESQAHYLKQVMRITPEEVVEVFNGHDGLWHAHASPNGKRDMLLRTAQKIAEQQHVPDLMVCFAPPRGGRLETVLEKATELGASIIQPIKMRRSVVDKINHDKALSTLREAAEQSGRMDMPELKPMIGFEQFLGAWNPQRSLIFGDETGASAPIALAAQTPQSYAVLVGPEGGITPEELALLARVSAARGVALGPRILRVDTAVITLCALVQQAWGDWHQRPNFKETA